MKKRRIAGIMTSIAVVVVAVLVVAIVMATNGLKPATGSPPPNTDPRNGPVHVYGSIDKICDGTTLVYYDTDGDAGGVAVVANSPECP